MPAAQARSRSRCESRQPITEHLLQHDSPNAINRHQVRECPAASTDRPEVRPDLVWLVAVG